MTTQTPLVIKLGGTLFNDSQALNSLAQALANGQSRPVVLVHGGGVIVESLLIQLGYTSEKIDGLRVTPFSQIDAVAGALAGTANKKLTAALIAQHCAAVGVCIGDGGICQVSQLDAKLGAVGDCQPGNAELLNLLLSSQFIPVVSSIGISSQGQLYNVNADQAAVAIATMLQSPLVLLSDVAGVLDEHGQLIEHLDQAQAQALMDAGVINAGMMVKVKAALDAAQQSGQPVTLASWRDPHALAQLLNGHHSLGTQVSI